MKSAARAGALCLAAMCCFQPVSASHAADRQGHAALLPEALAASPACHGVRSRHPALVGQDLTIGLGGYAQGFEMPDARDPAHIIGFDPDMYDALDACLGTHHHFLVTSFTILVASIGSGRVDIGSLLYVTPERARRVSFVSVMHVVDGTIVRRDGVSLSTLQDLCGHVVAASAGAYEAVTLVPEQSSRCIAAHRPAIAIMLVQNADAALQSLKTRRADIVFAARPQAMAAAASDPALAFGFTVNLPITAGYPLAQSNAMLGAATLDAFRIIQATGLERRALSRWGLDPDAEQPASLVSLSPG